MERLSKLLPRLLIVGASARAAAHSAVRAGIEPICADLFADQDLQAVAKVLTIEAYPHSLPSDTATAPGCPWMYTGALENHHRIVSRISRQRPLLGNGPASLRLVRDPFYVHEILLNADLPALSVRPSTQTPPADGSWLRKPICGANGSGIHVWDAAAASRGDRASAPHYFQQFQAGTPISALFLATVGSTWLLGIARQMIGTPSLNAPTFGFCGALAPADEVTARVASQIARAGSCLAQACKLRGLFGCDFVYDT